MKLIFESPAKNRRNMTSPIKTKQMFDQCFKLSKVRKRPGTKLVLIYTRYSKLAIESLVVYAVLYIKII